MPAAIPLAIIGSAVGGVASSAIGASASGKAADAQVQAANNAANLQHQDAQAALDFNKLQYGNSLNLMSPYYNTGTSALNRLSFLMGLSPNQGLPPGVVNPNAPQNTNARGPAQFPGFNTGPQGSSGDAVLPMSVGQPGGTLIANRFSAFSPFGGGANTGVINAGINPGNTGQVPISQPNGVIPATTNQGGTGQVPRIDGGGLPGGVPTPGGDFGSLAQGFNEQFQAPTDVTEQNDPGYKFRMQQGQDAIERSAAARGGLLNTGTAKALSDYNQNAASGEYGNVYNRAAGEFERRYNIFKQNQNDLFNRFAALSGIGQTTAGQLSSAGQNAAGTNANILLTSGGQIGNDLQNAGAARASGYAGGANAITGGINNVTNSLTTLAMLNALKGGTGPAGF